MHIGHYHIQASHINRFPLDDTPNPQCDTCTKISNYIKLKISSFVADIIIISSLMFIISLICKFIFIFEKTSLINLKVKFSN